MSKNQNKIKDHIKNTKKKKNLRHPKREELNTASPKGLQHIFGDIRVIHSTILVSMQSRNSMRPYVSHFCSRAYFRWFIITPQTASKEGHWILTKSNQNIIFI